MKKSFILVLLLFQFIYPQESYKGKISLILDGEKIEAPVTSIVLRKEDKLILTSRAEFNEENKQVLISLEMVFPGDSLSEKQSDFRLNVKTSDRFEATGKEFSFHYPEETNDDVIIRYAFYNKDEHVSWEINSVSFQISAHPQFENKRIKFNGSFKGEFKSTLSENKNTLEIKDGEFEIII